MENMCECKDPEIIVVGNTTKYYACGICGKPFKDKEINWDFPSCTPTPCGSFRVTPWGDGHDDDHLDDLSVSEITCIYEE